jgi:hypothetical protein
MQLPFTTEQFFAIFSLYNSTVWPAQIFLVLLAVLSVVFIALRRSWSGVAVSAILALLWIWLGAAYHLAFFARINTLAYGFGTMSIVGGLLFAWHGVIQRRIEFNIDKSVRTGFGITGTYGFIKTSVGDLFGRRLKHLDLSDGIQAEDAQVVPQMAPGVQEPVVTVVHQPLWRYFPRGGDAVLAVEVPDFEALAGHGGSGYRFKEFGFHNAFAGADDADAPGHILGAQAMLVHQLGQSRLQRPQLGAKQAGLKLFQQLLNGDQGQDFTLAEPQAGQFFIGVVQVQRVAAKFVVERDGHMQLVAQFGNVALERG